METISKSSVHQMVHNASDLVGCAWTLKHFVASNPLQGFENQPFKNIVKSAAEYISCKTLPASFISQQAYGEGSFDLNILESVASQYGQEGQALKQNIIEEIQGHRIEYQTYQSHFDQGYYSFAKAVNTDLIKWLEVFFDQGQAIVNMPYRKEGLFKAWKKLAIYENFEAEHREKIINWIEALSDNPDEVIELCLNKLGFSQDKWQEYLNASVFRLNGWSSFIKWMTTYNADSSFAQQYPINFSDYLATRLSIEVIKSIELNYGLGNRIIKDKIDDTYITRSLIVL